MKSLLSLVLLLREFALVSLPARAVLSETGDQPSWPELCVYLFFPLPFPRGSKVTFRWKEIRQTFINMKYYVSLYSIMSILDLTK